MKCKYERAIDKLERWIAKRKKQLKLIAPDPYGIMPTGFPTEINWQIKELDNVKSILHNLKLKADKMKL